MIRNRTPHAPSPWMSIADVARELGVSAQTARRKVQDGSIPGGERMYAHGRGERWHVLREAFRAWRESETKAAVG